MRSHDPFRNRAWAARLLVVDDAPATVEILGRNLAAAGHHVLTATSVARAIELLEEHALDLVITDLKMPGAGGLELTRHVRENYKHTEIMIITGYPSVESAVQAVKNGAEEYLAKPFTEQELLLAVDRVLRKLNARSSRGPAQRSRFAPYGLIGESPAMLGLFDSIAAAAAASSPVLVEGEGGTGKEAVARAIHDQAVGASRPFLSLRCDSAPEERLEAELFGDRGRARRGWAGLLAAAETGTLYLASLGDVRPRVQAHLAEWLKSARRGARIIASCEDQLVAATGAPGPLLPELTLALGSQRIRIPPLRQRGADLELLAEHFASHVAAAWGRSPITLEEDAREALRRHSWPGNVRELRLLIRRLSVELPGGRIQAADLPAHLRFRFAVRSEPGSTRSLEEVEAEHIRNVMVSLEGNKARAAEALGIDRKTLRQKLRRYGLDS